MPSLFARHSSGIDWCEGNYRHSNSIAEFYNTVSNVAFFLLPPLMHYLFAPYGRQRGPAVHAVWLLMMVVGACSIYFHWTLSYVGQLLDELSILWVLATAYVLWFPKRLFPTVLNRNRFHFGVLVFVGALACSVLSFLRPTINAYALNSIALQIIYVMVTEMKRCANRDVLRLSLMLVVLWSLAIACWISDRFQCSFWQGLGFPYLHSIWHVMIAISSTYCCVLFSYFEAVTEVPHLKPRVCYWPKRSWEFGVPYIALEAGQANGKSC
ncbi:alkaline ceramidase 1 isoform X2 [Lampetra fluviatilis]